MFSTVFVPNTVPNSVIKKDITTQNIDDLHKLVRTKPTDVPLSVEGAYEVTGRLGQHQT